MVRFFGGGYSRTPGLTEILRKRLLRVVLEYDQGINFGRDLLALVFTWLLLSLGE